MAEYANPPEWSAAPSDGQVPVYSAALDRLVPTAIASVGALTVPQTHIAAFAAVAAKTSSANATAAAATQTSSYVEADVQTIATLANALQTSLNLTTADVATLITELTNLRTSYNTLLTELQTAGVLASS
jgi:hypothetical protein